MTEQKVRQLRADTRTEAAEVPATLFAALARFQADLPRILKGNTAKVPGKDGKQGYSYDYADLADVSDAVLKQLGALGLFFTAKPLHRKEDGKFGLEYTLGHVSGEREDGWWELRSDLPMQQMGGMITYARRYILLAVTGAHPDGEDDDAASSQHVASRKSAGDAWQEASPVRPRPDQTGASGDDTQPWHAMALEQARAGKFKSEAEAWKLWREAAARTIAGEATPGQQDEIQNTVAKWVRGQRRKTAAIILQPMAEDDPWRDKILDDLGSDEEARGALEEVRQQLAGGLLDDDRASLLGRAVIARFPKAAITEASDA